MPRHPILNFRFLSLCALSLLAICNVAVFFNFHWYLSQIGFGAKEAGFLIGLYSLASMILYATVSQRITPENAYHYMLAGILITAGCGVAYTFATGFLPLALVRIANGAGLFLVMASAMVILVHIIPGNKTGAAFSAYSVALLVPYSLMPAVAELTRPWIDSPPQLYMYTACLLIPAAALILLIQSGNRARRSSSAPPPDTRPHTSAMRKNLLRKPVLALLLVNGVYFTLFTAHFYLFKAFALQNGLSSPGFFFTVQMGVMVAIRLLGGGIFDRFSKALLVVLSLLITGTGFLLLYLLPDPSWILYIAMVFGAGMGLCIPPLNSLMYLVTPPEFRGYNQNMLMMTIHFGNFIGPFCGSWIIDIGGYHLFYLIAALLTACAALFFAAANPARDIGISSVESPVGACR